MEESHSLTVKPWMEDCHNNFNKLEDIDKLDFVNSIIGLCPATVLYKLSGQLDNLLKRDFIAHLPHEVAHHLLSFLPPQTLLCCCSVSSKWQDIIESCTFVWRSACLRSVVNHKHILASQESKYYKELFIRSHKHYLHLKRGDHCVEPVCVCSGHTDRVMAVWYNDGKLATGSDDHSVRIWDCKEASCINVLNTHTVGNIHFL